MLALLRIKNLALVEELEWHPHAGFIAVTGETGAGKSIILGALQLLLGERTDRSIVRSGAETGSVEAVYHLKSNTVLREILEAQSIESDGEELILRRVITSSGTSKQFVNGSPCNLGFLRELGEHLLDLHGPHDHQSLFSRDEQTRLLDSYAGSVNQHQEYVDARKKFIALKTERETLFSDEQAAKREQEMLSHQVREIEAAALKAGEEEELIRHHRIASNAQRLHEVSAQLVAKLSESDASVLNHLAETAKLLKDLAKLDPTLEPLMEQHTSATLQIEEIVSEISSYTSQLESDPKHNQMIEERLDTVQNLKRKYGSSIEEILIYFEDSKARLEKIENRDERLKELDSAIASAETHCVKAGRKLSEMRKASAPKLSKTISTHLRDLGFLKSEFSVTFEPLPEGGVAGFELAEFLFAPNPGEPAGNLRSIASSGEISRVMLALKSALARQDKIPVLIFDEIDANVGGEIANHVGEKMRELGKHHQVFCITHLPQVAAAASSQFVVVKEIQGGRTLSTLREVRGEERQDEIARMLGGKKPSAVAHAKALLNA
ncbi:MAG: DNA repair protein RecN [Chthoniobacterales bacterium]